LNYPELPPTIRRGRSRLRRGIGECGVD